MTRRDPKQTAGFGDGINLALPAAKKKQGDTIPVGIRISRSLLNEIDQAANQYNVPRSRLMAYALRQFMDQLQVDPGVLKFENKKVLPRG